MINWGNGNKFHLDNLRSAFCYDDPSIDPGQPPANFNSYWGNTGAAAQAPIMVRLGR